MMSVFSNQVIDSIAIATFYMDVNRLMLLAVEEKRKTEESEDFRHISINYETKIGNYF